MSILQGRRGFDGRSHTSPQDPMCGEPQPDASDSILHYYRTVDVSIPCNIYDTVRAPVHYTIVCYYAILYTNSRGAWGGARLQLQDDNNDKTIMIMILMIILTIMIIQ